MGMEGEADGIEPVRLSLVRKSPNTLKGRNIGVRVDQTVTTKLEYGCAAPKRRGGCRCASARATEAQQASSGLEISCAR
jgi:hypothetical protein